VALDWVRLPTTTRDSLESNKQ